MLLTSFDSFIEEDQKNAAFSVLLFAVRHICYLESSKKGSHKALFLKIARFALTKSFVGDQFQSILKETMSHFPSGVLSHYTESFISLIFEVTAEHEALMNNCADIVTDLLTLFSESKV